MESRLAARRKILAEAQADVDAKVAGATAPAAAERAALLELHEALGGELEGLRALLAAKEAELLASGEALVQADARWGCLGQRRRVGVARLGCRAAGWSWKGQGRATGAGPGQSQLTRAALPACLPSFRIAAAAGKFSKLVAGLEADAADVAAQEAALEEARRAAEGGSAKAGAEAELLRERAAALELQVCVCVGGGACLRGCVRRLAACHC
jgi:hypothetical protein